MKRLCLVLLGLLVLAAGCRLQPKGTTAFKLLDEREFDTAQLQFPASDEYRRPLKLRYVDKNVFQTSMTLVPGVYTISAKMHTGMHVGREVRIEPDKFFYEVDTRMSGSERVAKGIPVSGEIVGGGVKGVVVLFIAADLTVRREVLEGNRFTADAPSRGTYRLEIHALGAPVRSWIRESITIDSPTKLGRIELK